MIRVLGASVLALSVVLAGSVNAESFLRIGPGSFFAMNGGPPDAGTNFPGGYEPIGISASPGTWRVGNNVSFGIDIEGGSGDIVVDVQNLPAGLTFSAGTRLVSGQPTTAGNRSIAVTADDDVADPVTAHFPIQIAPLLSLTIAGDEHNWNVGETLQIAGAPTGLIGGATWSLSGTNGADASGLPSGLAFNASAGTITGTPVATGVSSGWTMILEDQHDHAIASQTFDIHVVAAAGNSGDIAIDTSAIGSTLRVGSDVAVPVSATGNGPVTITVSGIPGISYNSQTGQLTGSPISSNPSAVLSITATDSGGTRTVNIPLNVLPALTPSVAGTGSGTVTIIEGGSLNLSGSTTGSAGSVTWGGVNLPPGANVNSQTGAVTGTITTPGTYPGVQIKVTDSADGSEALSPPFTIIVTALHENYWPVMLGLLNGMKSMDARGMSITPLTTTKWIVQNGFLPAGKYAADDSINGTLVYPLLSNGGRGVETRAQRQAAPAQNRVFFSSYQSKQVCKSIISGMVTVPAGMRLELTTNTVQSGLRTATYPAGSTVSPLVCIDSQDIKVYY